VKVALNTPTKLPCPCQHLKEPSVMDESLKEMTFEMMTQTFLIPWLQLQSTRMVSWQLRKQ